MKYTISAIKKIKASLFSLLLFMGVHSHANKNINYKNLSKHAGLKTLTMKKIVKKLVKIESPRKGYKAKNKSGAYGRYQIMPKTAKYYTSKLNIAHYKWKRPINQDKIFTAITRDNIRSLKKNGLTVNAFSIYGTHQQGANGFNIIMKKKKLSKKMERNLRQNLPKRYKYVSGIKLRNAWVRFWKQKFA